MSAENKKLDKTSTNVKTSVIEQKEDALVKPEISSERARSIFNEVSKLVGGAEAIHVAQAKIKELESERDQLRNQVDKLLINSEALQRQIDELRGAQDNSSKKQKNKIEILEDEKALLRERLTAVEKEFQKVKKQNDEFEMRFQNDLQKIRIKEREYENKNIILKSENEALAQSKDQTILDLKAKLDQAQFEALQFKNKIKETESEKNNLIDAKLRATKALRMGLNILETELVDASSEVTKIKKVAGDD